jgi:hypothetical protein
MSGGKYAPGKDLTVRLYAGSLSADCSKRFTGSSKTLASIGLANGIRCSFSIQCSIQCKTTLSPEGPSRTVANLPFSPLAQGVEEEFRARRNRASSSLPDINPEARLREAISVKKVACAT